MGFLCINKEGKLIVTQEELLEAKFVRDIGLNNTYNLNPEIIICPEIFKSPEYYVGGAIKLVSGITTTLTGCTTGNTSLAIYNLDYIPVFETSFVITGGTDYTGYTGDFCYKIFSDNRFVVSPPVSGFITGTEIIDSCTTFSAITASVVTQTYVEGLLPRNWAEYLIRPYYGFVSKECSPGIIVDTWKSSPQLNIFQEDSDYYFMTVIDPPTPILNPPGGESIPNYTLITDRLYINGVSGQRGVQSINGDLNYFLLRSIPTDGTLILTLNGVQLTDGFDYSLISQGYGVPPIVKLQNSLQDWDWLLATYITGVPDSWSTNFGIYFMDQIVLDGFTVDATPNYRLPGDNTLNFNSVSGAFEFFTSLAIDPEFSLIITVNGIKLANDVQYFKSKSFDGRIIFNGTTFQLGDVITVLAVSKLGTTTYNYGSLKTREFLAQWSVPPSFTNDKVTGKFIVQAFNDKTNVLLNQGTVSYVDGESNYSYLFTNLPQGINFRFRVTFEATYPAYLGNNVITCSYSEGKFDTNNKFNELTY